jgi:hypothetical protein
MARTHGTVEAELPDLLVRPWRRPFLWLHSRRCPACRGQLARLREVDRLLRQALAAGPPSGDVSALDARDALHHDGRGKAAER